MFNFISRREKHTEKIQNLLESDIPSIELRLYSSEVISLQRQNPDVIITKGEPFKDNLYRCKVEKRK